MAETSSYRCIRPHCPELCGGCTRAIPTSDTARVLMADVLDALALDGHGGVLEDGECEVVDRARAWLNQANFAAPLKAAMEVDKDAKTWAAYVAGIVETYLQWSPSPEVREKAIAGIIERRLWALPPAATPAAPSGEPRMQRTISRLQKQVTDLKASRDHFQRLAAPSAGVTGAQVAAFKAAFHQAHSLAATCSDYNACVAAGLHAALAQPAPVQQPLKDHQIAKLVNDLRDVAKEYGQTQQLRERIAGVVREALAAPVQQDAPAPSMVGDATSVLRALLSHGFAEDCQECAIGQSEAWALAKALVAEVVRSAPVRQETLDVKVAALRSLSRGELRYVRQVHCGTGRKTRDRFSTMEENAEPPFVDFQKRPLELGLLREIDDGRDVTTTFDPFDLLAQVGDVKRGVW